MKLSRNEKEVGIFAKGDSAGKFCESWQKAMTACNLKTTAIDASIAYIMAVKDESELTIIREGCLVWAEIFKSYLKPHISEIISDVHVSWSVCLTWL